MSDKTSVENLKNRIGEVNEMLDEAFKGMGDSRLSAQLDGDEADSESRYDKYLKRYDTLTKLLTALLKSYDEARTIDSETTVKDKAKPLTPLEQLRQKEQKRTGR